MFTGAICTTSCFTSAGSIVKRAPPRRGTAPTGPTCHALPKLSPTGITGDGRPHEKYTDDQITRAAEMREAGSTLEAIAVELDMTRGAVEWHCLRQGADHPKAAVLPHRGPMTMRRGGHVLRRFSDEEDRQLLALEAQGLSVGQIAKRLDCKHNSIINRLATLARREARTESADA